MWQTNLSVLVLLISPLMALPTSDHLELIILHNNDMHARFEQTDAMSTNCNADDAAANRCYGGFARIAYKVREFRNGSTSVLFLNAGDTYTGTPWFNIYHDKIVTEFMNLLQPDVVCLGNHEFDKNLAGLIPYLEQAAYPIVTANLDLSKVPQLAAITNLKKSTVLTVNGVNVGIIGYLTPRTKIITPQNDVEFTDEIGAVNIEAAKLKGAGVSIIIALGHSGFAVDKQIARECEDIDLVIGGHDNTFLWNGPKPDLEIPLGPYPVIVQQASGRNVPVVQAYALTKYLGYLKLKFDGFGELVEYQGQPILLNGDVPQDQEALDLLEKLRPSVEIYEKMILTNSKVFLNGSCKFSECNLGNLIADSMVDAYINRHIANGHQWSDLSIGILNSGGIRTSGSPGNFSMSDLLTILPFGSDLTTLHLTGAELKQVLEHSVHRYSYTIRRGEFLQVSGIHVTFNLTQPSGARVHSVFVLCTECLVPRYVPLDVAKVYKIVTTSYLSLGGDDYSVLARSAAEYIEVLDVEATVQYIDKLHFIYPALDGRIRFIGQLQDELAKSGLPGHSNMNKFSLSMAIIFCFCVVLNDVLSNMWI